METVNPAASRVERGAVSLPADASLLVVTVGRIGDTLLCTPVMRALRQAWPCGSLTVLAHPKRLDVLRHLPFIDRLGAIDKIRAPWLGRMGSPLHAAAVVFGREPALLHYALRVAKRVVAFDDPAFGAHERLFTIPFREGTHAVVERARLAEVLGVTVSDRRLAYRVTPEERAAARARLAARWPRGGGPLVGLQMSSFPTKAHRDWPTALFSALADGIVRERPDARFVVMGDAHARADAAPFLQAHRDRTLLAAGGTSLREAGALLAELDLYVGVDTGPTHMAGALGVPMVALYHCEFPGRFLAPLDRPNCRVIEHPLTGDERCGGQGMEAIGVDEVHQAAMQLLSASAASAA